MEDGGGEMGVPAGNRLARSAGHLAEEDQLIAEPGGPHLADVIGGGNARQALRSLWQNHGVAGALGERRIGRDGRGLGNFRLQLSSPESGGRRRGGCRSRGGILAEWLIGGESGRGGGLRLHAADAAGILIDLAGGLLLGELSAERPPATGFRRQHLVGLRLLGDREAVGQAVIAGDGLFHGFCSLAALVEIAVLLIGVILTELIGGDGLTLEGISQLTGGVGQGGYRRGLVGLGLARGPLRALRRVVHQHRFQEFELLCGRGLRQEH